MKSAFGVVVLLAAGLLLAGALGGASSGGTRASSAPVAPSRTAASNYLVTFAHGTSSSTQAAAITAAGASLVSSIAPLSMDTIKVPARSERHVLSALSANASVAGIALNRSRQSEGAVDPAYAQQWNLQQIGWDKLHGSVKLHGSATIAVLDTGVSRAGGDLNLLKGWSAFKTKPTNDPNGHGTAVASIAAAVTGNGTGVAGVDFAKAKILPVQVLNSNGLGLDSDIVKGVVWAANHHAKVILMSFSNPGYSQALQDAINYAWHKGAVVVAATGNGASTAPTYPAGDAKVVGVAGTDQSDAPWASSNTGADTFLAAPATSIPADARDGSETSITGTSASAAMVAGAAALLFAKDPKATNAIVDGRLARNADPVGTTAQTGNGRLNLARAFADTRTKRVVPVGAPGGGPVVGPYRSAASHISSVTVGAQSPASIAPGGSATYAITSAWNGSGSDTAALSIISWSPSTPAGLTVGFSPSTLTNSVTSSTLTIGTTGATAPGTYTFTVQATGSAGTQTDTGTLTVVSSTATQLAFTTTAQTLTAGVTSGTVTVERENSGGSATTVGGAITVNLSTSSGGGVFRDTGDTTTITSVTIASGASSASFKYKDTVAGTPTITAASTGLTSATQIETVNPASANKLVFGQQPTSALSKATISPAVTVKVEDTFNNVRTADNTTSVSLAIGTNGGTFAAGTLTGGGATTASSGIATFSGLSINNVGTNYTLAASATSLTGATSSAFNITARALTITGAANSKTYDATTSAATTPTVTGTIAAGDTANFSETYDTKNVGSGKTLTPSGTVTDGNAGHNYSYTFVASTNGTINARALTVTGAANTKVYDATTSAATAPTFGALQGSDTGNFVETYDTKNVGSGKTMTPSGTVNDGNSGNNYTYTFVASTNGTITARALTVTGAANTKTYDATTSAATAPTFGALQGSDTGNFVETYNNKNVGSGKTMTPSGTVNDGNSGNNYSYTFVTSANGTINARALTVTGAANTKVYDATTSAATAPTFGALQGSDTGNFVETYDTKNVGSGKTMTPSGTVNDGNSGNNYTYTFVASTNGTITARALTVTGAANTKTYDATTSAATAPTFGALQGSDTGNFVETYNNKNVGSGKTMTPSGTVNDGNSGNNYSYTFVTSANGTINARALTVTGAANTKVYDATTSAATAPTFGALQGSDTGNFVETYDTKNVGSGKTMTPSGTVNDGNSGNNYTYTFVASTNGTITALALTVTAQANSKAYDATTSAATAPSITSGSLQGSDTPSFVETYNNKNVGTGKTLTPSGTVSDGNGGNNYTYTFVASTNGTITARALTVTAQTNTKTYDSTTSAAANPTITSGALQGSDSANFTEVYANANAGTGKTLIPSGTVTDGNSGNNYSYTFVNDTTGVINARALTVTAQTNTKTYDSTTSAAAIPQITSGTLQGSDTANFTEVYANANAGTGKTLTPSGTVTDGNSGNNYTYTFVNDTTGVINQRSLTVTAQTNTKTYDSTTSAAATPTITSGALQGSDSANFTEVYANANAGTGKTLTPSGTVSDGNGGNNYSYTFVDDTTGVINQRPITITADSGQTKVYGNSDPAFTYTVTSGSLVGSDSFIGSLSRAAGEDVGTYAITIGSVAISDGNGGNNYALTYNGANFSITQRALTITASGQSKTYGTSLSLGTSAFTTSGNEANGELVTSVTLTSTSGNDASTTAPVGTYSGDIVPSGATGSNGFLASNYNITYVNGDLSITQRALTITASGQSKTYGTSLSLGTSAFTTSGNEANGELVTSVTLTSTSGNDTNTSAPVGTYPGDIVPSAATGSNGFLASNYNITYVNGDLTVTAADFTKSSDVHIDGTPTVATTLTITNAVFSPTPANRTQQWELCDSSGNSCSNIGGATNKTYTPVAGDVGSTLRVVQTVSRSGYVDASSTSSASAIVANAAFTTTTAVAINGTATVDVPLTITAGSYSPTPTSITYQWRLCDSGGNNCSDIGGANSNTYTPVPSDAGSALRVVETVSKTGYNDGGSTSDRALVNTAPITTNTAVAVNGTPTVGTPATITPGAYTPSPTGRAYQWQKCDSTGATCTNISGANSTTFTPGAGAVGSTLRVVETVTKAGYSTGGSRSAPSALVVKASFSTTTAVSVNGTPTVGAATTLTAGSYTPAPTGTSYQWELCDSTGALSSCAGIGGATSTTYTPVPGDVGSTLRVVETVSKTGYNDGGSTSAASPVVVNPSFSVTTAVAINGTPTVGTATTITGGVYSPAPTSRSYQWRLCDSSGNSCSDIGGAMSNTYTPVPTDVGSTLRVKETVSKVGYNDRSSTSAPVAVNGVFATNTTVAINGTPTVGTQSTITAGTYTPSPTGRSYQWQRCDTSGLSCVAISGATYATYTPVGADAGKTLRVVETVTKSLYASGGSTSAASAPVAKGTFAVNSDVQVFGYPRQGIASTVTQGSYTPTPTSRTYQWMRCTSTGLASCTNISGATAKTYTPTAADVGKRLRVIETVSAAGYNDFSDTSAASVAVTT